MQARCGRSAGETQASSSLLWRYSEIRREVQQGAAPHLAEELATRKISVEELSNVRLPQQLRVQAVHALVRVEPRRAGGHAGRRGGGGGMRGCSARAGQRARGPLGRACGCGVAEQSASVADAVARVPAQPRQRVSTARRRLLERPLQIAAGWPAGLEAAAGRCMLVCVWRRWRWRRWRRPAWRWWRRQLQCSGCRRRGRCRGAVSDKRPGCGQRRRR